MVAQQRNSYNSSNYVGCNLFILFRCNTCYTNNNPIAFDIFFSKAVCIYLMINSSNSAIDKKLLTRKDHSQTAFFQTIINLESKNTMNRILTLYPLLLLCGTASHNK